MTSTESATHPEHTTGSAATPVIPATSNVSSSPVSWVQANPPSAASLPPASTGTSSTSTHTSKPAPAPPSPQLFAEHGEARFRRLESTALASALARTNTVLALGGGTPEDLTNRLLLEQTPGTFTVFLDAPFPTLFDRCMLQDIARPRPRRPRRRSTPLRTPPPALPPPRRPHHRHRQPDTSPNRRRPAIRSIPLTTSQSFQSKSSNVKQNTVTHFREKTRQINKIKTYRSTHPKSHHKRTKAHHFNQPYCCFK